MLVVGDDDVAAGTVGVNDRAGQRRAGRPGRRLRRPGCGREVDAKAVDGDGHGVSGLDRLWAGWRSEYSAGAQRSTAATAAGACSAGSSSSGQPDEETYVVHRGARAAVLLNAYPYTSGHLMAMPLRHVADLDDLDDDEADELWALIRQATGAVRRAYRPEGLNVGANLGKAAGAGVPGHLHVHVLPRWAGDTNFMTSVAEARVMPEALGPTWAKLRAAWSPTGGGAPDGSAPVGSSAASSPTADPS